MKKETIKVYRYFYINSGLVSITRCSFNYPPEESNMKLHVMTKEVLKSDVEREYKEFTNCSQIEDLAYRVFLHCFDVNKNDEYHAQVEELLYGRV